ncbi:MULTISPECIES: Sec-independent protein translocase protein TatB [Rhodopseudomonas]|uniref:Sec-independent protein translocase protein TatB n=1 Tax=Rhodopseudomonas palustris TaxID=1076 RepID=A0A0D7EE02_RHOPL|nr:MULTISPECIES: Sec-independent protein translocase protein TatB [Rhodopseudomonas]KIZ38861.1 preprotein translocase subunit TatB [Rhodopseudomonas palustris]MDF3809242.1 Sec-independent protein translocase protein TatB [Rhodopseudomonas sp. BAL398]WOK19073.1 Sec-independent protein translocase protein TatB [Rhodopseudomonas sp. BAL398]
MFDFGWSELVLIAVVALIAIGPKELPGVLRMVGQWVGKARRMASDFQGQFNEAMREAELSDLKQTFDEVKESATKFGSDNVMTSLQKDVSAAMNIDKVESIDTPPVTPTTPEPPTPETFVEAERHGVPTETANEPLAVTQENRAALPAPETPPSDQPAPSAPVDLTPDQIKDAKAS